MVPRNAGRPSKLSPQGDNLGISKDVWYKWRKAYEIDKDVLYNWGLRSRCCGSACR